MSLASSYGNAAPPAIPQCIPMEPCPFAGPAARNRIPAQIAGTSQRLGVRSTLYTLAPPLIPDRLPRLHRLLPRGLELVSLRPRRHRVGPGEARPQQEGQARVFGGAGVIVTLPVLVPGLVVDVLLVGLELLAAVTGGLADHVGPELQVGGGHSGFGEIALVGAVKAPAGGKRIGGDGPARGPAHTGEVGAERRCSHAAH